MRVPGVHKPQLSSSLQPDGPLDELLPLVPELLFPLPALVDVPELLVAELVELPDPDPELFEVVAEFGFRM